MKNNNQVNPWKGLSSYTYQDAERFYGRDKELKEITSVIKQNAFTTLYGISGAGKTSIINAGLFPLLERDSFLPIYIRLDHNAGHAPYDSQIIKAINSALDTVNAETEDIVGQVIESEMDKLWLYFHSHRFWTKDNHIITPIIFIDQFEEIFTKNDDSGCIWTFFNSIDSLQYSTPTERILIAMDKINHYVSFGEEQNFRIVFSMREDFLPRLEDYSYNIPALRKNRIGLKPLNGLQALEVILKPRPEMVTREVALHIISKVTGKDIKDNERKLEATSVDTSILSLFCTELYNYALKDNKGKITVPLVDLYGGNILEWFYDRNMQTLPKQIYVYLEDQLLTLSGFRNSVALENLLNNGVLQEQLDLLAENRIIRIEDVNHSLRVEFTHDVLCKIAKARRDERDTINRMKDEKTARRAFTIDNIILFSAFALGLIAIFFKGIEGNILPYLLSFPLFTFLYMIITQRAIADKNLSNCLWFLIGCAIAELILISGTLSFEDYLNNAFSIDTDKTKPIGWTLMLFIPLSLLLLPYAIWIKSALQVKFPLFKSIKICACLYFIYILLQNVLLFYIYNNYINNIYISNYEFNSYIRVYCLIPTIILILSPIYGLYHYIKKKKISLLTRYSCTYSVYLACVVTFIVFHNFYSDNYDNLVALGTIWIVLGILSIFYAIQYMKQPKQYSLASYCNNVFSFQAFKKYSSFKPRLTTIFICFIILMIGVTSTQYKDIIPFISLPLAYILALHAGCSETKATKPKTAWSGKWIIPLIVLSEIIVASQYRTGILPYTAIICAFLVSFIAYRRLTQKTQIERIFGGVGFFKINLKAFIFSFLIGFILPIICLGYNVYNPSLSGIARVWNGTISSNAHNIYFITVRNEKGDLGVMDYSEIIVTPEFSKISTTCTIGTSVVKALYPLRYFFIDFLDISNKGNEENTNELSNINQYMPFFYASKGDSYSIKGDYFLRFENKYGKYLVDKWLKNYNLFYPALFINDNNKCISEKDRYSAIIKLFISQLAKNTMSDLYQFHDQINIAEPVEAALPSEEVIDLEKNNDDSLSILLAKCFNEVTLRPLLKKSNLFSLDQLNKTAMDVAYLFAYDKTGQLEDIILGKLWDKVKEKDLSTTSDDRPLLYLISGNEKMSEKTAKSSYLASPHNIDAFCNLYIALFSNGKTSEMNDILLEYKANELSDQNNVLSFYHTLASKLSLLANWHVIHDKNEIIKQVSKVIPTNSTVQEYLSDDAKAIDLGLPSGTKWASCNIGANKPEEYGNYYAWGEIEDNTNYSWNTYSHCDGSKVGCYLLGMNISNTDYDTAKMIWGIGWQMPSSEQIEELIKNCSFEIMIVNDIKGGKFTGPNGNSIFLPAAGYYSESEIFDKGKTGYYWTSSMYTDYDKSNAYSIKIEIDCNDYQPEPPQTSYESRCCGLPVRPVWNPEPPV